MWRPTLPVLGRAASIIFCNRLLFRIPQLIRNCTTGVKPERVVFVDMFALPYGGERSHLHRRYPTSAKTPLLKKGQGRPATLADVAREAGVGAMTASRAINRNGYVSEEVRVRVLKAAEKLQYRPNVLARHLRGQRLNAVGVMLPDVANPFFSELIAGIRKVLDKEGYTAFLSVSDGGVEQERTGLQAFVDHRVDGLIVATQSSNIGDQVIKTLVQQGMPVVTIGRAMSNVKVDVISANHYQGAFDLTTHLIDR